uniref:hypothetical protein n=1 Tax=Hafnia alvei TaxID=569 RepID=UPI00266BCF0F|nr:hypothetical protein [Hafnia alvei]
MKIIIEIVLYNKSFADSMTLMSIFSMRDYLGRYPIKIYIQDNSDQSMLDPNFLCELSKHIECEYVHSPQNLTLREIYNYRISQLSSGDYLCLLDDDTTLTEKYFSSAIHCIQMKPEIGLIVPTIKVHNKTYSPHRSYYFYNKPIKKNLKGQQPTRFMSAINSGMIINSAFFLKSEFTYPAYADFYGTDKVFFDRYSEFYEYFYVLDVCIEHNVSNHPKNPDDVSYINIINKTVRFWTSYLRDKKIILFLYFTYMFLYTLKLSIVRKNNVFILNFIKKRFKK